MRALSDATAAMLKPMRLHAWDRLALDVDEEHKRFVAHVYATPGHFAGTVATSQWLGRIPERKQLHDARPNVWQLAATDYTAEIIRAVWPEQQVVWLSEVAYQLYATLLLADEVQDNSAEIYARFRATGELPDGVKELLQHPDHPATPYQLCATYLAMRSEGYGYFFEQGSGKTLPCILEVCTLAAQRSDANPLRVLIIPPKNVRSNWVREFQHFATVQGKIEVVRGGELDRIGHIIETLMPEAGCKYTICVMGYEAATRSLDVLQGFNWDLVVLDEGHFIKSPSTQRFATAMALRDVAKRRRVLTGTPVCNSPLDLFALFEFMGAGFSGFVNWQNFKKFYGVFIQPEGTSHQKLIGVQNMPFLKERLARMSFIISKREALPNLPEKVYDIYEVEMSETQTAAYKQLAEHLVIEIENELNAAENKSLIINSILTQLLRLAQIASGFIVWDEVADPVTLAVARAKTLEWFNPDPKLDALVEIARDKQPEQKTIVWSCFVPCIRRISERFTTEGIEHVTFFGETSDADRAEAERKFNNDPDCRWFVGNPAAGGVGLNLLGHPVYGNGDSLTNCDHVIYYAQDWSYVKRAQSEDRAHRRGTRCNVRITDLVVPETIDEEIRCRVLEKKMMAMDIGDIREILGSIMKGVGV